MVISVNGMIAREDGSEDWLPHEGYEDMVEAVKRYDNLIFGRETYEYITQHEDPTYFSKVATKHQVLVTRDQSYASPESNISVANSPQQAVDLLETTGIQTALLIGGGKLNKSFLSAGLVDEVHLTVVPYILTDGRPVFSHGPFESRLELLSSDRLSLGRVLNKYKVVKSEL